MQSTGSSYDLLSNGTQDFLFLTSTSRTHESKFQHTQWLLYLIWVPRESDKNVSYSLGWLMKTENFLNIKICDGKKILNTFVAFNQNITSPQALQQ